MIELDRRRFVQGVTAAGAALAVPGRAAAAPITRPIPASGERLPVIGMGTWITFNVGDDPGLRAARTQVLKTFFARGGGMIDSSPMYGSAEAVVGHGLAALGTQKGLFSATKVWTPVTFHGTRQIAESERLWGLDRFDLFQVHNLVNWEGHLETLRERQAAGRIRYVGITTSHGWRHEAMLKIMAAEKPDFAQFTYNIARREAEARLLPAAADLGIAVIANRPFQRGALIDAVAKHPLPPWAAEIDCANWAQFLLKFVVSHPAVTCVIPATSRVDHMTENMGALHGPLPDTKMRQRMIAYVESL